MAAAEIMPGDPVFRRETIPGYAGKKSGTEPRPYSCHFTLICCHYQLFIST